MHSTDAGTQRFIAFLDWLTWRRIALIASAGAIFVGIVVYVFIPLRYTATTCILPSETPSAVASLTMRPVVTPSRGGALSMVYGSPVLARMEQVLKSQRVRGKLVDKYQLEKCLALSREDTLKWLAQATKISVIGEGEVGLSIEVTCPRPSRMRSWLGNSSAFSTAEAKQMCAQMANEYVSALDEYTTTASVKSAKDTRRFIEERVAEVQTALNETEGQLEQLQTEYLLMAPDSKASQLVETANVTGRQYAEAVADVQEVAHSLDSARSRLSSENATRISQETTRRNPIIVSLEERLASLRTDLASQTAEGRSARHPDVVTTRSAMSDVERQLDEVTRDVLQQITRQPNPLHDSLLQDVTRLEVQLAGMHARQDKLSQQVEAAENALRELPPVAREYVHMDRKRRIQTETLTALTRQSELAAIQEQQESSERFEVLDEAAAPERKSGPSTIRNAAVTFVVIAGLLTLGLAYRRGLFTDYDASEQA